MRRLLVLAAALLAAGGCSYETTQLRPAPDAARPANNPRAGEATVEGVHVLVDGGRWKDEQPEEHLLSPVYVRLENHSGHPLRLRYDQFTLGASGFRFAALPPVQVWARQDTYAYAPSFGFSGFYVAPWWGPYYPGVPVWGAGFAFDPFYYDRYYGGWPAGYPSDTVLRKAIPEGVIEDGGGVAGFLYFEDLRGHGPEVIFRADLVDARTNERFGEVEIPFLLVRDGKVVGQLQLHP